MTIRCGNHGFGAHVYHDSAADVRACYAGTLANDHDFDPPAEREHRTNTFGPDNEQPTMDQALKDEAYWGKQMQDKEAAEDERVAAYKARRDSAPWPEDPTVALNAQARTRTSTHSDGWTKTDLKLDHVPEGGYAVEDPGDGKLRFLEVDKPDEPGSKWHGFTFVKVRASDELHKLGNVNPRYGTYAGKAAALVAVLAGADTHELGQYRIRFGTELGECGFCRRSLTDEDSRGLGYGPVCAGRNGLPHPRARMS